MEHLQWINYPLVSGVSTLTRIQILYAIDSLKETFFKGEVRQNTQENRLMHKF